MKPSVVTMARQEFCKHRRLLAGTVIATIGLIVLAYATTASWSRSSLTDVDPRLSPPDALLILSSDYAPSYGAALASAYPLGDLLTIVSVAVLVGSEHRWRTAGQAAALRGRGRHIIVVIMVAETVTTVIVLTAMGAALVAAPFARDAVDIMMNQNVSPVPRLPLPATVMIAAGALLSAWLNTAVTILLTTLSRSTTGGVLLSVLSYLPSLVVSRPSRALAVLPLEWRSAWSHATVVYLDAGVVADVGPRLALPTPVLALGLTGWITLCLGVTMWWSVRRDFQ